MRRLILNYFSLARLKMQFANKRLSWFVVYDSDCIISTKSKIQRFAIIRDTKIEDYSYIGYSSNLNRVTVGKFCSISKYVSIGLTHHPSNYLSTSPVFFTAKNATGYQWVDKDSYDDRPKPVTIGNDVWIGANCTVTFGVNIGEGSIVGANSLVNKDVLPYSVVGGVPAKFLKYR